ncbi:transketolase [Pseudonocardia asaccharolytica]|uniref:Transketolase n=1 Tax=Pseudonocardia asaccharolytica DSM 44247 = NBRC 16224 TaxID=1123024 RepID=A0A511D5G0_9PSEU|nr:transketolase [Pseudonocardia asaccharolytica]GEL19887.1 transketolase [Pseudonocardia asaccharolytica DSM 44247 = NBRC 16224]
MSTTGSAPASGALSPQLADVAGPANGTIQPAELDELAAATLRFLAADAVQAANSGHPGLPLGTATAAWVLWSRHLRHDPARADWPDRDRFVLSAGHGSMLLYALLHVFGYDLSLDELRRFRQLGSRTPGHPEVGPTPGVETTTGPLGQGLANAVGMALAERMLAARCNTAEHRVVDHRTWVLAGDGDLMEGISHEAASLAGRLRLGKLAVIYDDNNVTIDGPAERSCADDAAARFASYGWRTLWVDDGNDVAALDRAFAEVRRIEDRPTFITVKTTIGYGAVEVQGTPAAHGAPLGSATLAGMRRRFGWPDTPFHVPTAVRLAGTVRAGAGAQERVRWERTHAEWSQAHPDLAANFPLDRVPSAPDLGVLKPLADGATAGARTATRKASGSALQALAPVYPALVGGSADLAASTNTAIPGGDVGPGEYAGRTIHFGIREHAMAAAMNGIALHGGLRPFGSTFLVFADYLRPALRLAALMGQPVIHVFTHDSIYVGEDGPTHQPIEQLESLRIIPGLTVLRPADAAETALAWEFAAANLDGPTALVLSRQDLPVLGGSGLDDCRRFGARTVRAPSGGPDVVLAASGSEVSLSLVAAELLAARGVEAQVVSVLCRERLEGALRSGSYPRPTAPVVWIEAGVPTGWRALAGPRDTVIGVDRFGASGPGHEVADHLGLSASVVARTALATVGATSAGPAIPGRTPRA